MVFVAAVTGAFLFRLFGLAPGLVVPIIMSAWITFYVFPITNRLGSGLVGSRDFYRVVYPCKDAPHALTVGKDVPRSGDGKESQSLRDGTR